MICRNTSLMDFVKESNKRTSADISLDGYLEYLSVALHKLQISTERREWLHQQSEHWVEIGKRHVIEVYTADPLVEPEETTIIIIDGFENGKFWTIEEGLTETENDSAIGVQHAIALPKGDEDNE